MSERAAVFRDGAFVAAALDDPPATLPPGAALVRPARVGICGSDLLTLREGPAPGQGFGHEWFGPVAALADDARAVAGAVRVGDVVTSSAFLGCGRCGACVAGRTNHCAEVKILGAGPLGAARTWMVLPAAQLRAVPASLGDAAVLVEPASVAVETLAALRRTGGTPARAAVLGAGAIGVITALMLQREGASVTVFDPVASRRAAAGEAGLPVADPGAPADLAPHERRHDVVIDCSSCYGGGEGGWDLALRLAAKGGRLLAVAKYPGDRQVPLRPIASAGLTVVWLRGASLGALEGAAARWGGLLARHHEALVGDVVPLEQLGALLEQARDPARVRKVVVELRAG